MELSEPYILKDTGELKTFLAQAQKAWESRHPDRKKTRGKKSVAKEVYAFISEAWLELRTQGEMTQYKISKCAWKKNKKRSIHTYKKYTSEFVTLLALAGARVQLNDNDRELLAKTTGALTKKVARYQQALSAMTEQGGQLIAPSNDGFAQQLGNATAELLGSIIKAVSKNSSFTSPQ